MLELWQTEWCPASRRVREQLTELGVDYITRQVPVDKEHRPALKRLTGSDTIPALVLEDGTATIGEDSIRRYLDERFATPPGADAHRLKAAKARRRYLEEECECSQPATRSTPQPTSASARPPTASAKNSKQKVSESSAKSTSRPP